MLKKPGRRRLITILLPLLYIVSMVVLRAETSSVVHGMEIVTAPAPVLRQAAAPVARDDEETVAILNDLATSLEDGPTLKEGVALPQLGIAKQGFVVLLGDDAVVMINPEVTLRGEPTASQEGCLSLPGVYGRVMRSSEVTVRFWDEDWSEQRLDLSGPDAFVVQHENDHLQGILFTDKLLPEPETKPRLD
jgi:peptide deformylase